jgi:hypothetical protein
MAGRVDDGDDRRPGDHHRQGQRLAEVHPSARRLELETAPKVAPPELHPGARRYDDEQART